MKVVLLAGGFGVRGLVRIASNNRSTKGRLDESIFRPKPMIEE